MCVATFSRNTRSWLTITVGARSSFTRRSRRARPARSRLLVGSSRRKTSKRASRRLARPEAPGLPAGEGGDRLVQDRRRGRRRRGRCRCGRRSRRLRGRASDREPCCTPYRRRFRRSPCGWPATPSRLRPQRRPFDDQETHVPTPRFRCFGRVGRAGRAGWVGRVDRVDPAGRRALPEAGSRSWRRAGRR